MQGLYLLARVVHGKCKEGVTIFESQECNPVADAGSIPQDQVIVEFIPCSFCSSSSPSSVLPLSSLLLFSINTVYIFVTPAFPDYS